MLEPDECFFVHYLDYGYKKDRIKKESLGVYNKRKIKMDNQNDNSRTLWENWK